jgi:hypothetical protein
VPAHPVVTSSSAHKAVAIFPLFMASPKFLPDSVGLKSSRWSSLLSEGIFLWKPEPHLIHQAFQTSAIMSTRAI